VIEDILARLEKVRRTGPNNWMACCPAHEDRSPSLTLHASDTGLIVAKCHAECSFPEIVNAVGLGWDVWFPPKQKGDFSSPIKRAFPAADLLNAIADEAEILDIVLHDADWGLPLYKADIERAKLAINRIRAARSMALGK
jgi:hypothetical protein